ncbi:Transthyretin-like family protein, partial [Teladorsagia circumcincta]
MQSVAVEGTIKCNGLPAVNVPVELHVLETYSKATLDEARTDSKGYFRLWAYKYDYSDIEPKLTIIGNKCNYVA